MSDEKNGVSMIAAERERQITAEGYTPEHDDQHRLGEIADAAACHAATEGIYVLRQERVKGRGHAYRFRDPWPWSPSSDKRCQRREGDTKHASRIRDLVKAGALIAAEIDRLLRMEATPLTRCAADDDGDCDHAQCPQVRDGKPKRSGRSCPLYRGPEDA